ncbi:MAG TPA: choice-of-anchor tandem repeat GloVer-containing protein [Rhizomicrobium sp.]|jgi:uncharacterized repeat protein (TIGR03803 family)
MRRHLSFAVTASTFSFCLALAGAACIAATPASAHGFRVLHTFCKAGGSCSDGQNPSGGLVEDANGNLYGLTGFGGASTYGVAYELEHIANSQYKYKIVYNFGAGNDSAEPGGELILDTAGNLYGTAAFGGSGNGGTVFELVPNKRHDKWTEKILYNFCSQQNCNDGGAPTGGLTYAGAASGALYDGTSPLFGVTAGFGGEGGQAPSTAYELQPGAGFQLLHTFTGAEGDGAPAIGPLVADASGNLYGVTVQGGSDTTYAGVVYELSPAKNGYTETILHTFCPAYPCTDGSQPEGDMVMDASGNLYGTTYYGGASCQVDGYIGCGVAFMLKPDGIHSKETVLHAFCSAKHCADGVNPFGDLLMDAQGNIFGTTWLGGNKVGPYGQGTLFELSGSSLQVLHKFCQQANCTDGVTPNGALIRDSKGRLFGTTINGGAGQTQTYPGDGIVYELVP